MELALLVHLLVTDRLLLGLRSSLPRARGARAVLLARRFPPVSRRPPLLARPKANPHETILLETSPISKEPALGCKALWAWAELHFQAEELKPRNPTRVPPRPKKERAVGLGEYLAADARTVLAIDRAEFY